MGSYGSPVGESSLLLGPYISPGYWKRPPQTLWLKKAQIYLTGLEVQSQSSLTELKLRYGQDWLFLEAPGRIYFLTFYSGLEAACILWLLAFLPSFHPFTSISYLLLPFLTLVPIYKNPCDYI